MAQPMRSTMKHTHQHAVGESIVLKVLINHLLDLLDPSMPQAWMIDGSLEHNALQLISEYSVNQLSADLSHSDVHNGMINCTEAMAILADPLSDLELSSITRNELEQTIIDLHRDLENVAETNE